MTEDEVLAPRAKALMPLLGTGLGVPHLGPQTAEGR